MERDHQLLLTLPVTFTTGGSAAGDAGPRAGHTPRTGLVLLTPDTLLLLDSASDTLQHKVPICECSLVERGGAHTPVDQVELHLLPSSSSADAASTLQSSEFRPVEHFLHMQALLTAVPADSDHNSLEERRLGSELASHATTTVEEEGSLESRGRAEAGKEEEEEEEAKERRCVMLLNAHHAVLLMATFRSLRQYQLQPDGSYCTHSGIAEHFNPESFLSAHSNFS